jgi:hypothetical protein
MKRCRATSTMSCRARLIAALLAVSLSRIGFLWIPYEFRIPGIQSVLIVGREGGGDWSFNLYTDHLPYWTFHLFYWSFKLFYWSNILLPWRNISNWVVLLFRLWLPEFLSIWESVCHNPEWEQNMINIFSFVAWCNIGYVNWEPWLPKV